MADLRFVWDERKSVENRRKHHVTFEEARTVFFDDDALLIPDEKHSDSEDRFILLGLSSLVRALIVCHCYRQGETVIRIISARKANAAERGEYERRKMR